MATGCRWGEDSQHNLWIRALERLGSPRVRPGIEAWFSLQRYPALLLLYSGGISSLDVGRYGTLAALLTKPTMSEHSREYQAVTRLASTSVIDPNLIKSLPEYERYKTPVSEYLFQSLREPLRRTIPSDERYEKAYWPT